MCFDHVPLDLTDAAACSDACRNFTKVTHVIYAAVCERPGLVAGWHDVTNMQTNLAMLQNLLEPLANNALELQHVTLLQGAKAYCAHMGLRARVPARERAARVQHANFYWLQEDYLLDKARERGFAWTIFRPPVIVGAAWGAAMNPILPLAIYAELRRAEGKPFSYPGGELQISEIIDSSLLAQAFEWATTARTAHCETFNITNGDMFAWREAWPALADALQIDVGADDPMRLAEYIPERAEAWRRIEQRANLRPIELMKLLGESHHYADILLRMGADTIQRPTLLSTIKLRHAGFAACADSENAVRRCIAEMQRKNLIPTRLPAPRPTPAAG